MMRLINGDKLNVPKRHIKQVSDDVVRKVMKFILSSSNVVPNSSGVKNISLPSEETIILPRFQRKNI